MRSYISGEVHVNYATSVCAGSVNDLRCRRNYGVKLTQKSRLPASIEEQSQQQQQQQTR